MIFTRNQATSDANNQNWTYVAEALARRWEALTVADLAQIQRKLSQLAEIVQQRYQLTFDEARQQVTEFEQSLADEARQAYAALTAKVFDLKLRGSKLRHDISEFGWQVTGERLVARHPGYAVGLAAGLGVALGAAVGAVIVAATRPARRW